MSPSKCVLIRTFGFVVTSMLTLACYAERPPNDNELKAAYCLKIYQTRIPVGNEFSSLGPKFKEFQDSTIDGEKRLRGYLLPRLQSLDVDALLFATRRAEEDLESYKNTPCYLTVKEFWDVPVNQQSKKQKEEIEACFESISDSAATKRIRSCSNLSWLPF